MKLWTIANNHGGDNMTSINNLSDVPTSYIDNKIAFNKMIAGKLNTIYPSTPRAATVEGTGNILYRDIHGITYYIKLSVEIDSRLNALRVNVFTVCESGRNLILSTPLTDDEMMLYKYLIGSLPAMVTDGVTNRLSL